MSEKEAEVLPTRRSLLDRLKRWDDQESWHDFFESYWGLLYGTARKAGLEDAEAQDVVQDTIILVAGKMGGFRYDPAVDSFKGWLLYWTRKRIALAYRKRDRNRIESAADLDEQSLNLEQLPDPAGVDLEAVWEEEWARTLWEAAVARAKEQVAPKQFQMFHLYVVKEQPVTEVARVLGVTVAQVYLAKHRISTLLKRELNQLKAKLE
jgi:RNA polymerase sigma factor (sigma-70 family)